MSISGVSSCTGPFIPPPSNSSGSFSNASTAVSDVQSISSDLQSGNVAAAQQTFSSLSQLITSTNPAGPHPALTALGKALSSGNIAGATQALSWFGKNLAQFFQRVATNYSSQPAAVQQLDNLVASLDAIPGVSASSPNGANTANSNVNNPLNVVA